MIEPGRPRRGIDSYKPKPAIMGHELAPPDGNGVATVPFTCKGVSQLIARLAA
jgi:hypothetical protein